MTKQEYRRMPNGTVRKFIMRDVGIGGMITVADRHVCDTVEEFYKRYPKQVLSNLPGAQEVASVIGDLTDDQLKELGLTRTKTTRKRKSAAVEAEPEPETEGDREE